MKFGEMKIGNVYKTKPYKVTKEKIIEFASEFDSQYLHVDEEKAKRSRFKKIIAPGTHTLSISMKLWIECNVFGDDLIAGVGMKHVKFIKPVYPDDELHVFAEATEKVKKNEESGIITLLLSTYNHKDEKVLEAEVSALITA